MNLAGKEVKYKRYKSGRITEKFQDPMEDFFEIYEKALKEEIQYIKMNGSRRYKIMDGEYVERKNNYFIYTFDTEEELNIPEGTQVSIWTEKDTCQGIIYGCEEFTIILASKLRLGEKIETAEIEAEPWRLLSALIDRMEEMRKQPSELVRSLICHGKDETDPKIRKVTTGQDTAVKMSVSQPLTFIWGPPGTGKTYTLARIVWEHIRQGHRVLMVSQSNVSVDGAILKVHSMMEKDEAGVLVRYGYPRAGEILEHEYLNSYNLILYSYSDLIHERNNLIERRKKVSRTSKEYVEYTEELKKIKDFLSKEEKESVKKASFVATTVSKALIDPVIYESDFDVVIFDEASMAYIPQVVFAAGLAEKHFICMGDFKQLPPIVQGNPDSLLTSDIFQYTGISAAVANGRNHNWLCMLDVQYRMHYEIADFAGKMMYKGLLNSSYDIMENREKIAAAPPVRGCAVGLADMTGMMSVCFKTADNSRINILSAFAAICLAMEGAQKNEVGIITPYHAQSRLLHAMSRDLGEIQGHKITCATVHQFQGSEKDVIIYDAVDCYRMQCPGMMLTSTENEYANRLFNVALTRAKGKFIGVANIAYMNDKKLSDQLMFAKMIRSRRNKESCVKGMACLPADPYQLISKIRVYKRGQGNSDFYNDILYAKKEIRIDLPDAPEDDENLSELVQLLGRLKKSGVKITVRAENRGNLPESVKKMAVENPNVVNPIVIIDKKLVWFGEPLSRAGFIVNGKKQQMEYRPAIRFEGSYTAMALYGFLEMNKSTGCGHQLQREEDQKPVTDDFAGFVMKNIRCPGCGRTMRLKKSRKGRAFLSCSGYPLCGETRYVDLHYIEEYLHQDGGTGKKCRKCGYSLEGKLGPDGVYVQCCGMEHHKYDLEEI